MQGFARDLHRRVRGHPDAVHKFSACLRHNHLLARHFKFNPNQEHVCNTSPFLGDIFPPGCEEYFPSKMQGVYLGARDGADFVGDGPEDQHEPDARSAQPRDQRHLPFDEG